MRHGGGGNPTTTTADKGEQFFELSAGKVAETILAIRAARPYG